MLSEKNLFAGQELITCARLRGQDFAADKNFSSITKRFVFFLRRAIENFFSAFA